MTADAILWFLDFHGFVTAKALQMICSPKPGLQRLCLVELYTVAALTQRGLRTDRAIVMTALADDIFVPVEVRGRVAVSDVLAKLVHDLAVRHLCRLVFVRQHFDFHGLGNVIVREAERDLGWARSETVERRP